jgi:hypothetical protein
MLVLPVMVLTIGQGHHRYDRYAWFWWPSAPIPMSSVLARGSLVVVLGWLWRLASERPPRARRRRKWLGVVLTTLGAVFAIPALLIHTPEAIYMDFPGGEDMGAQIVGLSLVIASTLLAIGGWQLGSHPPPAPAEPTSPASGQPSTIHGSRQEAGSATR